MKRCCWCKTLKEKSFFSKNQNACKECYKKYRFGLIGRTRREIR